jgi:predicted dehydrogenase
MNLPNKLTLSRLAMTGLFAICMALGQEYEALHAPGRLEGLNFAYTAALILFIAAAITDYLDGAIARKRGLETDFGRLMDPLADKVLMTAETIPGVDEYTRMVEHFADCALNGTAPRYPVADAAANMRAIEALYASARAGGMPVEVASG